MVFEPLESWKAARKSMKQQTINLLLSVEGRSIASVEMGRVESIPMV